MKYAIIILLFCFSSIYAASHHPLDWIKSLEGRADKSQQIYQAYCKNCHDSKPVIPLGAPRVGVVKDWQGRKDLLNSTLLGKGMMPARGGCFECSDESLQEVIVYMLKFKNEKQIKNH